MRFITMQHADGTTSDWYEVNNAHPCPICGAQHQNQGWCLVKDDESMAFCKRVRKGSKKEVGNYGSLHILRDTPGPRQSPIRAAVRHRQPEEPKMAPEQVRERHRQHREYMYEYQRRTLSLDLGVSILALDQIQTGYKGDDWYTWPMYVGGQMVGIRYRHLDGRKLSLKGSRSGLFIPTNLRKHEALFVAEGATDTAAGLTIGLNVIGRPSCTGSHEEVERIACDLRPNLVVVVRDMGKATSVMSQTNSYEGAQALVRHLARVRAVKMYTPPAPARDLRDAVRNGLTATEVHETLEMDVKETPRTNRERKV